MVVVHPHYDRLERHFDVEEKEKYQDKIIHWEKEYHFDVNDIQNDHHQQLEQVEQVDLAVNNISDTGAERIHTYFERRYYTFFPRMHFCD